MSGSRAETILCVGPVIHCPLRRRTDQLNWWPWTESSRQPRCANTNVDVKEVLNKKVKKQHVEILTFVRMTRMEFKWWPGTESNRQPRCDDNVSSVRVLTECVIEQTTRENLVARDRIELPTRGFSVRNI